MKNALFKNVKGRVLLNEGLAAHLAYRIGGPADFFVAPKDEDDIREVLEVCEKNQIAMTIVGSGTNMLVRDRGIRGCVLFMGPTPHFEVKIVQEDEHGLLLRVPSNASKAALLEYALDHNFAGLEFSAGIPGTIGGAVYMNAGTKWGSYGDVIEKVLLYTPGRGLFEKTRDEMGFKYRGHGEGLLDGKTAVVAVDLRLKKTAKSLESRHLVDQILKERGSKQPLELPNCGSVFKNPPEGPGAGRLIESCGLKGHRIGNAQISLKHANFILNLGGAKAADVEALIRHIQATVKSKFSVDLQTEVIILGDSP